MSQFPQITGVEQDLRTFHIPNKTLYPTSFQFVSKKVPAQKSEHFGHPSQSSKKYNTEK